MYSPLLWAALMSNLVIICAENEKDFCGFVAQGLFSSDINISETSRCGSLRRIKSLLTTFETSMKFSIDRSITDCTSPMLLQINSTEGISSYPNSADKDVIIECIVPADGECTRLFFHLRQVYVDLVPSNELLTKFLDVISQKLLIKSRVSIAGCNSNGMESLIDNTEEVLLSNNYTRGLQEVWEYLNSGQSLISLKILHNLTYAHSFNTSLRALVRKLIISNQNVSSLLPYDLLANLTALETVDISHNGLYSLPENLFRHNSHLQFCDLSNNMLQAIPPNLFKHNTKLTALKLDHNYLETLPPELFSDNREIKRIILNRNRLSHLPSGLFVNNFKIENLLLAHNNLTELPRNLFPRNASLLELNLSHNQLTSINLTLLDDPTEKTIAELVRFDYVRRFLFLRPENRTLKIDGNTLVLTNLLIALNVSHNRLTDFPKDIFKQSQILRFLDASNNPGIRRFTNSHFLYSLEVITLTDCHIEYVEGILANTANSNDSLIKTLELSRNRIRGLGSTVFRNCHLLEEIFLKDNLLSHLEPGLFRDVVRLYYLDLSGNRFVALPFELFGIPSLVHLNVSGNRITTFGNLPLIDLLQDVKSNLQELDISRNCLTSSVISRNKTNILLSLAYANFEFNALSSVPLVPTRQRTFQLQFGSNAIRKIETNYLKIRPHTEQVNFVISDLLRPIAENIYISLCPNPIKEICQESNRSCEEATPENLRRLAKEFPYVDLKYCHGSQEKYNASFVLKVINFRCPFRPTCHKEYYQSFFCDGNATCDLHSRIVCPITDSCPFPCVCYRRGFEQQSIVNCSHRNLTSLPQFIPPDTEVLHFEHNRLTTLSELDEVKWKKLIEIYVDYNDIDYADFHRLPSAISKISLRHNRIRTIATDSLRTLTDEQIWLGGNPIHCDCNTLALKTLVSTSRVIIDGQDVLCVNFNRSVIDIGEEEMCEKKRRIVTSISLALVAGILLPTIVGVCLVAWYRNRRTIAAYVFIHHPKVFECFFSSDELVEDKEFDAFISYSGTDTPIVKQLIIHLEEKEPRLKLCIHERDWIPGEDIPTNIASSVSLSRKTILLLSEEFLKSIWFTVELRSAYYQSVEDNVNRLIVVLKGEVPPLETLDEDLQVLLRNKTYLVWGEKWFWEKLRYALSRDAM